MRFEKSLLTPRALFGLTLLDDTLYIIAGIGANDNHLASCEILHLRHNAQIFIRDFPEHRHAMKALTFNGCIYVCGGIRTLISRRGPNPRTVETKELRKYDPVCDVWTKEAKLVQYANTHACVVAKINTKRMFESEFISSA